MKDLSRLLYVRQFLFSMGWQEYEDKRLKTPYEVNEEIPDKEWEAFYYLVEEHEYSPSLEEGVL